MRRFPHLRRLTAVVTHLLLLQLAFVSAAGACPLGERGAGHRDMQMSGVSAPGGQQHPANAAIAPAHADESPASHHERGNHCDMSCTTASCAAAGHCIAQAALVRADTDHGIEPEQGKAGVRADAAPLSVSRAPEPPPPRA
ncbi:MAG TPA: hypothetical protein VFY85_02485 [Gemmatimonadaceae bacterium]|nr:hypothetical protein [Gemmatimonadaceae bacterium]